MGLLDERINIPTVASFLFEHDNILVRFANIVAYLRIPSTYVFKWILKAILCKVLSNILGCLVS